MIACSPGKLVLSGAYAVLEGAPAIVAAVDRFAVADGSRSSALVTEEVLAAVSSGYLDRVPWFDASALRGRDASGLGRKLGLGSSAAILVASLACVIASEIADERALRAAIFPLALEAHRSAQGGGSGVDVAASTWGGILTCRKVEDSRLDIEVQVHRLPLGTVIEVFASSISAKTSNLLSAIRKFRDADPQTYRRLMDRVGEGSRAAVQARTTEDFIASLALQLDGLEELGRFSGAPIFIEQVAALRRIAAEEGASFGPSGAGGGDIALFVGCAPSSDHFRMLAEKRGLTMLDLQVGARGVHTYESMEEMRRARES
jgi:phosphomevalonate kinase